MEEDSTGKDIKRNQKKSNNLTKFLRMLHVLLHIDSCVVLLSLQLKVLILKGAS